MNQQGRKGLAFDMLAADLEGRFLAEAHDDFSAEGFHTDALRAFRFQFEENATYRAFCRRRGATPDSVERWEDIPPVPTTAFKHLDLRSTSTPPDAVFRTSGTTEGKGARGRHFVPRLSLYRASALPSFRRHVTGEAAPLPFLSLVPHADGVPESSLSRMVTTAAAELSSRVDWLVSADGALDPDALGAALDRAVAVAEPVLIVGTALSFVHLLDRIRAHPRRMPEGSRVMETGGFKGNAHEVTRAALHTAITEGLGVAPDRIVNEYGMTELLSQLYEPVLSEGADASGMHIGPPWMRTRSLDPRTLEPLAEGEEGLLAFFDLANLGSVCHVLTQDIGSVIGGRLRLRGRIAGAEPRGCSRAMDELMSAAAAVG